MGSIRTGHLATLLIERLKPKCLVMCGVCAGNPGDLALGDVVISELVYQYDEGKREAEGLVGDHRQSPVSREWLTLASTIRANQLPSFGRPSSRDARYWLLERLSGGENPQKHPARSRYFQAGEWAVAIEALEREGALHVEGRALVLSEKGKAEVERSLLLDVDPPYTLPFELKIGPIASGNVVVKDGVTWEMLKQMGVRSVLGLEMEAATIGEIARASGIVNWIVAKGVMDHANPKKDDRFKPFAARASAEFLRAFLINHFSASNSHSPSRLHLDQAHATSLIPGWRPRTLNGHFFDELRVGISVGGPRFYSLFQIAVSQAVEAYGVSEQAEEVSNKVRISNSKEIIKAHRGRLGKRPKVLNVELNDRGNERPLIVKIWNSHDEYIGEAAGTEADGLGVVKMYRWSEEATPSLRSSYSGLHENGAFGPSGVYTFPDQTQFSGKWNVGHPILGYCEYLGEKTKLQCDFYLGEMQTCYVKGERFWRPHGEGIAVDAGRRHVRCGYLEEGEFLKVSCEFEF